MIRMSRIAAVSAGAVVAVALMTGCSSSPGSAQSSTAPASAQADGGASMLPPVIITEEQTAAAAKVGDFIDLVVKTVAGTTIDTDKPELLEITQAHEDGGAVFNPGAKALAPGTAVISVTNPDGSTRNVTITITE